MSSDGDKISVTIAYPSYIPRARGIHAVGKFGTFWKVLCSQADYDLVWDAANRVGVTRSEFIRWCAVMAAREVMRDDEPQSTDADGTVPAEQ